MRYNRTDERWSEGAGSEAIADGEDFIVPLSSAKGFKGRLRLKLRRINAD